MGFAFPLQFFWHLYGISETSDWLLIAQCVQEAVWCWNDQDCVGAVEGSALKILFIRAFPNLREPWTARYTPMVQRFVDLSFSDFYFYLF